MLRRMTRTVRRLKAKHPRIWGALWGGLAVALFSLVYPALVGRFPDFHVFLMDSLGIFSGISVGVFVLNSLRARKASGSVLLDVGPHPAEGRILILIVIFVLAGAYFDLAGVWNVGFGGALFWMSSVIFFAVLAFGRVQIREEGIWWVHSVVKWQKLASYDWDTAVAKGPGYDSETDSTLVFQVRTKLPFVGTRAYPIAIPFEHKAAVDELLEQHVGRAQHVPESRSG